MATLKKDDSISKREQFYWQQGANNPPDTCSADHPQWSDLDDPSSPANKAGVAVWSLLDVVAQCDYHGQPRKEEDMVALRATFAAYMDLAYVGAQHDQVEKWITSARNQYAMLVDLAARDPIWHA